MRQRRGFSLGFSGGALAGAARALLSALLLSILLAAALSACGGKPGGPDEEADSAKARALEAEKAAAQPDPRLAYASSRLLSGLPDPLGEPMVLAAPRGLPRLGPVASKDGRYLAYALAGPERLVLVDTVSGTAAAETRLGSPAVALAFLEAPGALLVAACLDGSLAAYDEGLAESWRRSGGPASALVTLPEKRLAVVEEGGTVHLLPAEGGEPLWRAEAGGRIFAAAYSPGALCLLAAAPQSPAAAPEAPTASGPAAAVSPPPAAPEAAIASGPAASPPAASPPAAAPTAASPSSGTASPAASPTAAGASSYLWRLFALSESDGRELWSRELESPAAHLSADGSRLALVTLSGGIELREAKDGILVARGAGRFDPGVPPILAGSSVFAALSGGGPAELDAATGVPKPSPAYPPEVRGGAISTLAADEDRVFAARGGSLAAWSRHSGSEPRMAELPIAPAASPVSAGGRLWLLGPGGELLSLGGPASDGQAFRSPLDALAPPGETAEAIASSLEKFKPRNGLPLDRYLRFDLFADGLPIGGEVPFVALRRSAGKAEKGLLYAAPEGGRILLAIFSESGEELSANVDELGAEARHEARFDEGKTYWLLTGRLDAEGGAYRIFYR